MTRVSGRQGLTLEVVLWPLCMQDGQTYDLLSLHTCTHKCIHTHCIYIICAHGAGLGALLGPRGRCFFALSDFYNDHSLDLGLESPQPLFPFSYLLICPRLSASLLQRALGFPWVTLIIWDNLHISRSLLSSHQQHPCLLGHKAMGQCLEWGHYSAYSHQEDRWL